MEKHVQEAPQDTPASRQVGVKKEPLSFYATITPENLKSLRLELGKSLAAFGVILARSAGKKRPYTKQYIARLEKGQDAITPELAAAFWRLAAAADDTDPLTATAQKCTVYAAYNLEGVFIAGQPVECARPGCSVRFVRLNHFQKYHSPYCRRQAENDRRQTEKHSR